MSEYPVTLWGDMGLRLKYAALAVGLMLFGGTVAGCDDVPAFIHEASGLSKDTFDGIAHDLRLPARDVPALEKKIPDTVVAHSLNDAVDGLDPSDANEVIANACDLAGISLGQPPPNYPDPLDVSKAENALRTSQNSRDWSEEFAAWAICSASQAADKVNS
jgi:hypothetical protein